MFELFLRLQPETEHGDPYNHLSWKFPGARISLWCNDAADILEIEAEGYASFEELQKELVTSSRMNGGKIISKTVWQNKFQLVARTCVCGKGGTPIGPIVHANNFMSVPPTVLFAGWEYHRYIGFDDNDVKGLLKGLDRLGKTEVLHKKNVSEGVTDDTFLLSLSSLFGQLTQKQLRALLSAVENGYYEIPKRITADDLARKQGQPRSTLEEHIRKAGSKIVLAMAPNMMMYARVPETPFNKTKAAGATVGARIMKQLVIQAAGRTRNN